MSNTPTVNDDFQTAMKVDEDKLRRREAVELHGLCPANQNPEKGKNLKQEEERISQEIRRVLGLYPTGMLVDSNKKSKDEIILQCLQILQQIKKSIICFDFLGSKLRIDIINIKDKVDLRRGSIIITDNVQLTKLTQVINGRVGDIHLPNGILRVSFQTDNKGIFEFKPIRFYPVCDRSKRDGMRINLIELYKEAEKLSKVKPFEDKKAEKISKETSVDKYFADAGVVESEDETSATTIKLPRHRFSVLDKTGKTVVGLLKDISSNGMSLYIPKKGSSRIEAGKTRFRFTLPFLSQSITVLLTVMNIDRENKDYCVLGCVFDFERDIANMQVVSSFVEEKDKDILSVINGLKDKYLGLDIGR